MDECVTCGSSRVDLLGHYGDCPLWSPKDPKNPTSVEREILARRRLNELRDAAPELLAALKDAISDLEDSIPHQDVSRTGTCACLRHRHIREARALIARLGG